MKIRTGWIKNISIRQKLYLVLIIMAILIAAEIFIFSFSIRSLAAVRAIITAEGTWSKAQKQAVIALNKYSRTGDILDYNRFLRSMRIPMGYKRARTALEMKEPDLEEASDGLIQGQTDYHDVENMIWLYTKFRDNKYLKEAFEISAKAHQMLLRLYPLGAKLHEEVISVEFDQKKVNLILAEVDLINESLHNYEEDFTDKLGTGALWLESLVLKVVILIAVTVELMGLLLTFSINANISKYIREIVRVSKAVEKNDLTKRARIFTNDEVGKLAQSFNNILDILNSHIQKQKAAEESLGTEHKRLEEYTAILEGNNKELEQLAYVTSHHLREPLRTISSYVQLLEARSKEKLDKESMNYLTSVLHAVNGMDALTKDLARYVELNRLGFEVVSVDCSEAVEAAIANLKIQIDKSGAKITVGSLPKISANKKQMILLFQNLLSNAINFSERIPEINISSAELETHWLFSVRDNGIGIDPKYKGKIFDIFQRINPAAYTDGTGIGLTICKKIVERHGGMIWVESEPGRGSVFYFTISKKII